MESIRNIIFADVIISFIEIIIPDTRRKKYFNFVSGLILAIILIKPFANIQQIEKAISDFDFNNQNISWDISENKDTFGVENMQEVIFKNKISGDINKLISGFIRSELKIEDVSVVTMFNDNYFKKNSAENSKEMDINDVVQEIRIFCIGKPSDYDVLKKYVKENIGIEGKKVKIISKGGLE